MTTLATSYVDFVFRVLQFQGSFKNAAVLQISYAPNKQLELEFKPTWICKRTGIN